MIYPTVCQLGKPGENSSRWFFQNGLYQLLRRLVEHFRQVFFFFSARDVRGIAPH
jgi:hypothetical protein